MDKRQDNRSFFLTKTGMTIPATEMKTPSCRPAPVHRVKDVLIKDGFNRLSRETH